MNVQQKIRDGAYKIDDKKFPVVQFKIDPTPRQAIAYRDARLARREENDRLQQQLRKDLAEEFEMTLHKKEEKVWEHAWHLGMRPDLIAVYDEYEALVEIAK
jgi:hypothetical protein